MLRHNLLLGLSLFLVLVTSAQAQPVKEWTWLVFVNGNNDLSPQSLTQINQMEWRGSTPVVNIVAQWATYEAETTQRLYIEKDKPRPSQPNLVTSPVVQSLPRVDMGDWRNLVEFIRWGVERYPAKRYVVTIWNHGNGVNGLSYDEHSGHHISLEQLGQAMRMAAEIMGHKVDIMVNMACAASTLELTAEIADSVEAFVGAQNDMAPGLNSTTIFDALNSESQLSTLKTATKMLGAIPTPYARAVLNLAEMGSLVENMKDLNQQLSKMDTADKKRLARAVRDRLPSQVRSNYGDVDLIQLANFLDENDDGFVRAETYQSLIRSFKQLVVLAEHAPNRAIHGLSLWLPREADERAKKTATFYETLYFHEMTGWGKTAWEFATIE